MRFALLLLLVLGAGRVLSAADSPGRFGFHTFPVAPGQDLGFASRPVYDGRSGFWFYEFGNLWRFDARGYRQLGPAEGLPKAPVDLAYPEPSTGMWFRAEGSWYLLNVHGVQRLTVPGTPSGSRVFAIRNEGLGIVEGNRLRIYRPSGAPLELPSPGPGDWVKGWKDPHTDDRLVVGDQGLARWNGHTWRIQPLEGLLEGRGADVFRTKSGALWVRSDRDLARIEPHPARFGRQMGFTRNSYVTIEEDSFGRVWTNGPEGLACVDGDHVWRIGVQEGLEGYQSYWPIAFDAQGNLWTISAAGFQQLKGAFLWSVQERPFGLPRTMIFTVQRSRHDGTLYAGTHDGLYRQNGGRWEEVKGTERWAPFTLAERANGELWCGGNPPGAHDLSIFRLIPGHGPVRPDIQGLPPGEWTFALAWTPDGTLWCLTAKGFYRIHPKGTAFMAEPVALPGLRPGTTPNALNLAPDGSLWVGTDQGVYRLDGTRWTHLGRADGLFADEADRAFLGPHGEWWVLHNASNAITRFAQVPGKGWQVVGGFDAKSPLTAMGAQAGWTDPKGIVWLLSGSDVVRWDGTRAEHFSKAFGVPIDNFFDICGEPDGQFWIGTVAGVIHCDPRFYRPIPDPPALVQGPATDGQGRPFPARAVLPFRSPGVAFELELPLVEGIEDLQIQTRVKGLDTTWHPLEGNTLRLPGLRPGSYVLQAHALRQDGVQGPTLSFPFRILPPWYFRPVALAAGLLLALGASVLILRWRTWTLRREQARLEGLVARRTQDLTHSNEALLKALGEVRTLKGLVPICSYCKRIRNDEGFWRQLELVLAEHTEAKFSHGICPECAEQVKAAWDVEKEAFEPIPRPPGP
jgi:hypothetical protein